MKKIFIPLFILWILAPFASIKADEGMWLPYMLGKQTMEDMKKSGCKLSAEQIFSFNQSSIKDAIVQFGGGCTGEIISSEGLLLTNHHCGLSQVQNHSSVEHDYLTNGFWAASKEEELPNPGLVVSFLSSIEDVTDKILSKVNESMEFSQRQAIIDSMIKLTIQNKKAEINKSVEVKISTFYHDNQYILFVYDVYKDVRLVGTPPWGIGKFGSDTDNWTWPRHKGDFCMFRVYTAPDGSPAEYAKENIPLKPKHFLPVSIKGVKEGDYAMILGYPGRTDRYSPSQKVEMTMKESAPSIVKCRTEKLNVFRKHMDADQAVFIKYASKQATVSNYWKYCIGQIKQLERNKVVPLKQALESRFAQWITIDPNRQAMYGHVLQDFAKSYDVLAKYEKAITYHKEAGLGGSEVISFAYSLKNIVDKKNPEEIKKALTDTRKRDIEKYFKDYDVSTDQEVATVLLSSFYQDVTPEMQPSEITKHGKAGDFTTYVADIFAKSVFTSPERFNKWMENPYDITADPVYLLLNNIYDSYVKLNKETEQARQLSKTANRLFMKGLMEMQTEKIFYPDANSTMRLTYGNVKGYSPANGIQYDFQTTLDGVMEKEIPGNWEFDVPAKLKELYLKKDYGRYADKNNQLVVNFITTDDITGGNSGSPVIDAKGNLIGLAFDGNWEAMSGDIAYDDKTKRTICMDARYLLFVIDKMANAQNIMKELKIIE